MHIQVAFTYAVPGIEGTKASIAHCRKVVLSVSNPFSEKGYIDPSGKIVADFSEAVIPPE